MSTIDAVKHFTQTFGQEWYEEPTVPSGKTALLRIQLIQEEAGELALALAAGDTLEALDALTDLQYVIDGTYGAFGVAGDYDCEPYYPCADEIGFTVVDVPAEKAVDLQGDFATSMGRLCWAMSLALSEGGVLEEVLLRLNEVNRVLQRMYSVFGLAPVKEAAFNEVHSSNMSKLDENGQPILNEAGRVVKGPNYFKPNLAQFLVEETLEQSSAA